MGESSEKGKNRPRTQVSDDLKQMTKQVTDPEDDSSFSNSQSVGVFTHNPAFGGLSVEHLSQQQGRGWGSRGCGTHCGQASPLSTVSSYYGNRQHRGWTEVRPSLHKEQAAIWANLGNGFSASSYVSHLSKLSSPGYKESHSNCLPAAAQEIRRHWGLLRLF